MQNKFFTAANADSKLRQFREAEKKAQNRQVMFIIAAVFTLLVLIFAYGLAL